MVGTAWTLFCEAAVYMLPGFAAAAALHAFVRGDRLLRHLQARGVRSVALATLVGAPLPLCSCSVLPTALTLRRKGASAGATSAFLVSTPETSVTSILLTYGLLGPLFAIYRPIAAIVSAIVAGLGADAVDRSRAAASPADAGGSCCHHSPAEPPEESLPIGRRIRSGIDFAFIDLVRDVFGWVVLGVVVAAALQVWVPQETLLGVLGGPVQAMLIMAVIGIPLYVCAEASTPIAAALIADGVSPGAALVFLLVGPATNIGSLGILTRELGRRVIAVYLGAIVVTALAAGLLLDRFAGRLPIGVDVEHLGHHAPGMLPTIAGVLFLLLGLATWGRAKWRRARGARTDAERAATVGS